MAQCTPRYLPLCAIPAQMSKDGYAGANAHIYQPFCGYHYFNGQLVTFPGSEIPQDQSLVVRGVQRPNNYSKNNCVC